MLKVVNNTTVWIKKLEYTFLIQTVVLLTTSNIYNELLVIVEGINGF